MIMVSTKENPKVGARRAQAYELRETLLSNQDRAVVNRGRAFGSQRVADAK